MSRMPSLSSDRMIVDQEEELFVRFAAGKLRVERFVEMASEVTSRCSAPLAVTYACRWRRHTGDNKALHHVSALHEHVKPARGTTRDERYLNKTTISVTKWMCKVETKT